MVYRDRTVENSYKKKSRGKNITVVLSAGQHRKLLYYPARQRARLSEAGSRGARTMRVRRPCSNWPGDPKEQNAACWWSLATAAVWFTDVSTY